MAKTYVSDKIKAVHHFHDYLEKLKKLLISKGLFIDKPIVVKYKDSSSDRDFIKVDGHHFLKTFNKKFAPPIIAEFYQDNYVIKALLKSFYGIEDGEEIHLGLAVFLQLEVRYPRGNGSNLVYHISPSKSISPITSGQFFKATIDEIDLFYNKFKYPEHICSMLRESLKALPENISAILGDIPSDKRKSGFYYNIELYKNRKRLLWIYIDMRSSNNGVICIVAREGGRFCLNKETRLNLPDIESTIKAMIDYSKTENIKEIEKHLNKSWTWNRF
jgi:hypothetical protein